MRLNCHLYKYIDSANCTINAIFSGQPDRRGETHVTRSTQNITNIITIYIIMLFSLFFYVVGSCHRPFLPATSLREQTVMPPLRLQVSDCSTFGTACHVPGRTVIFSEPSLLLLLLLLLHRRSFPSSSTPRVRQYGFSQSSSGWLKPITVSRRGSTDYFVPEIDRTIRGSESPTSEPPRE